MASAVFAAAAAAPAPAAAREATVAATACPRVQVLSFSPAQVIATRQYWTAGRLAASDQPVGVANGKQVPAQAELPVQSAAPAPAGAPAQPGGPDQTTSTQAAARPTPASTARCLDAAGAGQLSGVARPALGLALTGAASAFTGYPSVGELFTGGTALTPHCTASTISPPAGAANPKDLQLLVLTSAHCVEPVSGGVPHPASNIAFAPRFDSEGTDNAPYGLWVVGSVVIDSRWKRCANGCPEFDYAILVLNPSNGTQLGAVVGMNGWSYTRPRTVASARIVGYPDAGPRPLLAISRVVTVREGRRYYRRANSTPGFVGGTSGGPFFTSYDTTIGVGTLFGNIGGYQNGGASASPSYSPYWTADFGRLVATAFAVEKRRN